MTQPGLTWSIGLSQDGVLVVWPEPLLLSVTRPALG